MKPAVAHLMLLLLLASIFGGVGCAHQGRPEGPPAGASPDSMSLPPSADAQGRWVLGVGDERVQVLLADTPAMRYSGLAGVAELGPDEGMLFLYPEESLRSFWMEGCLVGLDIAWIGRDGRVVAVDTLPAPRPGASAPARAGSPGPVQAVLELPAGWFQRHGLGPGTVVTRPADMPMRGQ